MNIDTSFSGYKPQKKTKTVKDQVQQDIKTVDMTGDMKPLVTPTSPVYMSREIDGDVSSASLSPSKYHHTYVTTRSDPKDYNTFSKETHDIPNISPSMTHNNTSLMESIYFTDASSNSETNRNEDPKVINVNTDEQEQQITSANRKKPSVDQVDLPKRNMEIPDYVLDPLSVIVKLAILSKKPLGSKLCIDNNIIYINEPGFFQSLVRFVFNKNKYDLHFLFNPIEIACNKYLVDRVKVTSNSISMNSDFTSGEQQQVSEDNESTDPMVSLFKSAVEGLYMLVKTYEKENILTHTLYFYINIILSHLGKNYNKELFIRDSNTDVYQELLLKNLEDVWTIDRVNYMLSTFSFIQKSKDGESTTKNIKCLEEFMKQIDGYVTETIKVLNIACNEDEEKKEV